MSISQDINDIRNAKYGRDVREAIADGLEQCYADVSAGKTVADSAALEAQTAANIASAAAETANSAAEAAAGYPSIIARVYAGEGESYSAGEYCVNIGVMYKAKANLSNVSSFNPKHWIKVTNSSEMKAIAEGYITYHNPDPYSYPGYNPSSTPTYACPIAIARLGDRYVFNGYVPSGATAAKILVLDDINGKVGGAWPTERGSYELVLADGHTYECRLHYVSGTVSSQSTPPGQTSPNIGIHIAICAAGNYAQFGRIQDGQDFYADHAARVEYDSSLYPNGICPTVVITHRNIQNPETENKLVFTDYTVDITLHDITEELSRNEKLDKPETDGTQGQVLTANGDGTSSWANIGNPTDQQVGSAVSTWLSQHPDATTTVEDGSVTEAKLSSALRKSVIKDYATPEQFGAAGDGTTDDTDAFLLAVADAQDKDIPLLLIGEYRITRPILIEHHITITRNQKLVQRKVINGSTKTPVKGRIVYAPPGGPGNSEYNGQYAITFDAKSESLDIDIHLQAASSISMEYHLGIGGIRVMNAMHSTIRVQVYNFSVGLNLFGNGTDCNYNLVYPEFIQSCKTGILLNTSSGSGSVNQNTFIGGSVRISSDAHTHSIGDPEYFQDLHITYAATSPANNNSFFGVSFEHRTAPAGYVTKPNYITIDGAHNMLVNCRYEGVNAIRRYTPREHSDRNVFNSIIGGYESDNISYEGDTRGVVLNQGGGFVTCSGPYRIRTNFSDTDDGKVLTFSSATKTDNGYIAGNGNALFKVLNADSLSVNLVNAKNTDTGTIFIGGDNAIVMHNSGDAHFKAVHSDRISVTDDLEHEVVAISGDGSVVANKAKVNMIEWPDTDYSDVSPTIRLTDEYPDPGLSTQFRPVSDIVIVDDVTGENQAQRLFIKTDKENNTWRHILCSYASNVRPTEHLYDGFSMIDTSFTSPKPIWYYNGGWIDATGATV